MITLKPCNSQDILPFLTDFKKKARYYEVPPEQAESLGIYKNNELIGYFIITCYSDDTMVINQGYLKPEVRHKSYSKIAMSLLEILAKKNGLLKVKLATTRAVGSYQKFMRDMGYALTSAEFTKELI